MARPKAKFDIVAEDKTARAFKSVDGRLDAMGRAAKATTAIVVAAAAALGAATVKAVNHADSIGKVADKLGIGTTALQVYRFQAERTGVSQQALEMGVQRLGRRLGQIAQFGKSEASPALKQLGVDALDSAGRARKLEDIIPEISDKLATMTNRQEQLAIMQKLVDSEGVALINTWGKGSAALKAMEQQAFDTGVILDEALVRKAERASDQLGVMGDVIKTKTMAALLEFLPNMAGFADGLGKWIDKGVLAASAIAHLTRNIIGLNRATDEMKLGELNLELADVDEAIARLEGGGKDSRRAGNQKRLQNLRQRGDEIRAAIEGIKAAGGGIDDTLDKLTLLAGSSSGGGSGSGGGLGGVSDSADKAAERYGAFIKGLRDGNRVLDLQARGLGKQVPLLQAQIRARDILGRDLLPDETAELEKLVAQQNKLNEAIENEVLARQAAKAAADKAQRDMEKAAEAAERPFKQASENIQTAFGDMFTDIFRGGKDGFTSFADSVKNIFARLAGEIAAMMVIRPMLGGIGLGGLLGSGAANAAGGGLFGGGVGGGGGGLSGLSNLFSTGNSFLSGGLAGIADNSLNLFGRAGGALQGMFGVNPITTGLGSALALGGPLALLGGAVGGSTGAGIGGGFGAGFSVGGPIGGLIGGALGGAIGGLFGGGSLPTRPKVTIYGNSLTGNTRVDPGSEAADAGPYQTLASQIALGSREILGSFGVELNEQFRIWALQGQAGFVTANQQFVNGGDPRGAFVNQQFGAPGGRTATPSQQTITQLAEATTLALVKRGALDIDNPRIRAAVRGTNSLARVEEIAQFYHAYTSLVEQNTTQVDQATAALDQINSVFNDMESEARRLGLALGPIADARNREIAALRAQQQLTPAGSLLASLTGSTNSTLPFSDVLANAQQQFSSAVATGNQSIIASAGQNLIGVSDAGFATGQAGAAVRAAVTDALRAVVDGNTGALTNSNAELADLIAALVDEVRGLRADNNDLNDQMARILAA